MTNFDDLDSDLADEIQEERQGFDLLDRLVNRPKRKPEVVTLYLNEELGQELGFAKDVRNELGVKIGRIREGVYGELDAELEKPEEERDEELIKKLRARVQKLAKAIKKDSLTFTLQWVPPVVEESIDRSARKALGVKGQVPQERKAEYMKVWLDRALQATVISVVDNKTGDQKDRLSIEEAQRLREYAPKGQVDRLDEALGKLLNRDAISREAIDSADF